MFGCWSRVCIYLLIQNVVEKYLEAVGEILEVFILLS